MVKEAEEFKDQDKMYADKVEARNSFESYVYSLRNTAEEKGITEKLDEEERAALKEAIDSALAWLDDNQAAEKDEFDARRKELEEVATPLLMKAQAGGQGQAAPHDGEAAGGDEPTVEEVD